jgi:dUTP pyrophosphatase
MSKTPGEAINNDSFDPATLEEVDWGEGTLPVTSPLPEKEPRLRGFEVVSYYEGKGIRLPRRKTAFSAGYDLGAAEDVVMPAEKGSLIVIPTGIKAYMQPGEALEIHIRSGLSFGNVVSLVNGTGIIDSDYYNNPSNEGHIQIGIVNLSGKGFEIRKGQAVAQGIFKKFFLVDGDNAEAKRVGGFGSTGD